MFRECFEELRIASGKHTDSDAPRLPAFRGAGATEKARAGFQKDDMEPSTEPLHEGEFGIRCEQLARVHTCGRRRRRRTRGRELHPQQVPPVSRTGERRTGIEATETRLHRTPHHGTVRWRRADRAGAHHDVTPLASQILGDDLGRNDIVRTVPCNFRQQYGRERRFGRYCRVCSSPRRVPGSQQLIRTLSVLAGGILVVATTRFSIGLVILAEYTDTNEKAASENQESW